MATPAPAVQPISPRIAALEREKAAGNAAALAAFWREVADRGAPLIEPLPGDDRRCLVTFLWRAAGGEGETRNVVVLTATPTGGWLEALDSADPHDAQDPAGNQLTHLPDTDLWHQTYRARRDARGTYKLSPNDTLVPDAAVTDWAARTATWQPDPLNPHRLVPEPPDDEHLWGPRNDFTRHSVVELPDATPQPWLAPRPDVPAGRVERHLVRSALLGNERRVWIYTPPDYTPAAGPYDLVLLLDGWHARHVLRAPTTLDNMLAARAIAPTVAVLVDALDLPTRGRELRCAAPFTTFLTQELLPWVHQRYRVTDDPARTVVGGISAAGRAAALAVLRHPERFGNVLSQSGWVAPSGAQMGIAGGDHEPEWLARQFAAGPRLPLRFYLHAGVFEGDLPAANRHLRTVLQARGYEVHYPEFVGAHSWACWRGTLADGLLALLGDRRDAH